MNWYLENCKYLKLMIHRIQRWGRLVSIPTPHISSPMNHQLLKIDQLKLSLTDEFRRACHDDTVMTQDDD